MPRRTVTFRGRALLLLAWVWAGMGAYIWVVGDTDRNHQLLLEYLPMWVRSGVWWVSAGVAAWFAWSPPDRTRWGFVALVIPAVLRTTSYAAALIIDPHLIAAVQLLIWAPITHFIIKVLAPWAEPPAPAVTQPGARA